MGKTAFSGPVYGAKSLLWSFGPVTGTSQATTAVAAVTAFRQVPLYEDWYVTDAWVACSTCSSAGNDFILKTEGGSTTGIPRANGVSTRNATIFTVNTNGSTTLSTMVEITKSAGEYEGTWIPAGSTLRFVSSGVNPQGQVSLQLMGFIRHIDSTRQVL